MEDMSKESKKLEQIAELEKDIKNEKTAALLFGLLEFALGTTDTLILNELAKMAQEDVRSAISLALLILGNVAAAYGFIDSIVKTSNLETLKKYLEIVNENKKENTKLLK